jgi:hypothetical protein
MAVQQVSFFDDASLQPPGPPLVTRKELAKRLGVHPITITKWEGEGLPVERRGRAGKPSLYREDAVLVWHTHREQGREHATAKADPFAARARRETAQAALAEQAYRMRERDLLPRHEVETTWAAEVARVKAAILAWRSTLADPLCRAAVTHGVAAVEQLLDKETAHLLAELSAPPHAEPPRARRTKKLPAQPLEAHA